MRKIFLFSSLIAIALAISCFSDPPGGDDPAPPMGNWVEYTSDAYWQCQANCGGWNGSVWTEAGPGMVLVTASGSTWQNGYRPTKVRVTYSASGPATIGVGLYAGGIDFGVGDVLSTEELNLNVTSDIVRINLYITGTVSKIEFYEE